MHHININVSTLRITLGIVIFLLLAHARFQLGFLRRGEAERVQLSLELGGIGFALPDSVFCCLLDLLKVLDFLGEVLALSIPLVAVLLLLVDIPADCLCCQVWVLGLLLFWLLLF